MSLLDRAESTAQGLAGSARERSGAASTGENSRRSEGGKDQTTGNLKNAWRDRQGRVR